MSKNNEVSDDLLHDLFIKCAAANPSATAVSDGVSSLTYRELDELSDRLAVTLQEMGAKVDSSVVIYMNKSIEYVISYIAILKAGAAYLPMDAAYPKEMVSMVLQDAEPAVVLVSSIFAENVSTFPKLFVFSSEWESHIAPVSSKPLRFPAQTNESLAYVVYSSGTTGKPKGICCPHRGAVVSYAWRAKEYPYCAGEREAANVFFVWELLRPLLHGQTLFVIPDSTIYDQEKLPAFIKDNGITRMLFTPSLLEAMLDSADAKTVTDNFKSMTLIVLCGEVVTVALRNKCRQLLPSTRIHNLYSISECHDVAGSDLTDDESLDLTRKFCPVGSHLPGVQIHILDENMSEVPSGVHGEVYISGPTLARGYLRRPELDAARFLIVPVSGGAVSGRARANSELTLAREGVLRMYRTGDVGYLVAGGRLEICGRCDSMVKVRGYSIELHAVQVALLELSALVADCVVVALGDAADVDKTLVAYIVPTTSYSSGETSRVAKRDLRTALKRRLPFYMVPSNFVFLESIPVHPSSGKLNHKALPSLDDILLDAAREGVAFVPSSPDEIAVAEIFADVLALPDSRGVDVTDSFFDLGGHSLVTIPLLQKINAKFSVNMELSDLFRHPSVRELTKFATGELKDDDASTNALDLQAEVTLNFSIKDISYQMRAFWRHVEREQMYKTSRVLLTGATGFLGSFLLRDLLVNTKAFVLVLVRPPRENEIQKGGTPMDTCRARVWATMQSHGLVYSEKNTTGVTEEDFKNRVNLLVGDAALESLGLESEDFDYLGQHVDLVIHAAAQVNLVYPYTALMPSNVRGTANIIDFCTTGKVKPLHYVSSNAVLPPGEEVDEEMDARIFGQVLKGGYAQSKWVGERLVSKAIDEGLPAAIYRCGNLSGGVHGGWNPRDSNLRLMRECIQTQSVPIWSSDILTSDSQSLCDFELEMTPVDFVARFIVECSQHIRQSNRKIFHLMQTVDNRCSLGDFLRLGQEIWGANMRAVALEDWVKLKDVTMTAAEVLELCSRLPNIHRRNVTEQLKLFQASGVSIPSEYPRGDPARMRSYLKMLSNAGLVMGPPVESNVGPLGDKIVMVTGSSSGIGAGVAQSLLKAGAFVVLVARREKQLIELVSKMPEGCRDRALVCAADVTDGETLKKVVLKAEAHFNGAIWGLINCAGVMHYQKVMDCDEVSWAQQIDVNCKGVLNGVASVLPSMKTHRRGHIVNISSDAGKKVFAGLAVYSATKHFVEAFAEGFRQECAPFGIKVTNIQPGDVRTELLNHTRDMNALSEFGPGVDAEMLEVEDIANAILFALTQKGRCAVNEILIEPTGCPI